MENPMWKRLEVLMEALGWSQADLAKAAGIHATQLSRFKRLAATDASAMLGMPKLIRLAQAANVSVLWLATGDGDVSDAYDPREIDESAARNMLLQYELRNKQSADDFYKQVDPYPSRPAVLAALSGMYGVEKYIVEAMKAENHGGSDPGEEYWWSRPAYYKDRAARVRKELGLDVPSPPGVSDDE